MKENTLGPFSIGKCIFSRRYFQQRMYSEILKIVCVMATTTIPCNSISHWSFHAIHISEYKVSVNILHIWNCWYKKKPEKHTNAKENS